jgi:NAD(P)-dependent dehydrogenase (short-subunit alcohol dehydrogenase family)
MSLPSRQFIVITGANRGIGKATAEKLARTGHQILIASRNLERGQQAAAEIRAATGACMIETMELDLSRFESIHHFADALKRRTPIVDVLIHNAAVLIPSGTRRLTEDGCEETLAVNALGPFLLTRLALPALANSSSARIICVSSRLHIPGQYGKPPRFDFADPHMRQSYDPGIAYANSKLALIWFTYQLARRLPAGGPRVNAICPGFVPSSAASNANGWLRFALRYVLPVMPFATSISQASDRIAWLATSEQMAGITGRYFQGAREAASSPESYDDAKARRYWEFACHATGCGDWP